MFLQQQPIASETQPASQSAPPNLPPLGSITEQDHSDVWGFLSQLVLENIEARQDWTEKADDNLNIFLYGATEQPADDKLVVNEIQNAIISATDIQTKEPPAVTLEPVETGDKPQAYFAGPPEGAMQLMQMGVMLMPEQVEPWTEDGVNVQPPMPLQEGQVDMLHQLITQQMMKEEWLVEVNDQLVADTYQGVFDVYWSRAQTDRRVRSMLLHTNVQGWVLWLYEFDDDRKTHRIRPLSIKQTYIDPTVEDINDAAYAGVDLVLDADEAKKLYPDLSDAIDKYAHIGVPAKIDGQTNYGGVFDSRNFRRKIVELRVFWLRNQPCPMQPDQAIAGGHVEQREVPDITNPAPDFTNQPEISGEAPDGTAPSPDPSQHSQDAGGGEESPQQPGNDAGDTSAVVAAPAQMRAAHFLPGTDTEVTPDHPQWPSYLCIRQITALAGIIIDDRECEFFDIPLIHNVNIPIPARPWGQGEPERLRKIQDARNEMLDAMVQHTKYFKHPLGAMPESMAKALESAYGTARLEPGRTLRVPDDLWQLTGGKVDTFFDPPDLSPAQVNLSDNLKTEITELSGHADVLQGRASPQVKSGKAIELLQSAASSMIGFKSQRTGDAVDRLARLMLHSLVNRLSLDELNEVVSKYPPHILDAIQQRAKQIEWDVKVIVSSGNGTILQAKKQEAIELFQLGLISWETCLERLNIDVRVERQRMQQQQQAMAQAQAAMMPLQTPNPGQPGGENQTAAGQ